MIDNLHPSMETFRRRRLTTSKIPKNNANSDRKTRIDIPEQMMNGLCWSRSQ